MIKQEDTIKLLTLNENKFAKNLLNQYEKWWEKNDSLFSGWLQRAYVVKLINNKETKLTIKEANCIPYIEVSAMCRKKENGLLFINCNPSGTNYDYYKEKNQGERVSFYYDNPNNSYFIKSKEIAQQLGMEDNFAMIDFFPIVIKKQAELKDKFDKAFKPNGDKKLKKAFEELITVFLDAIVELNPKVIIVTNAYVRDLLTQELVSLKYVEDDKSQNDKDKDENYSVCHNIIIPDSKDSNSNRTFKLFCGGMIAGGHQMDIDSRERLFCDVRKFLSNNKLTVEQPRDVKANRSNK